METKYFIIAVMAVAVTGLALGGVISTVIDNPAYRPPVSALKGLDAGYCYCRECVSKSFFDNTSDFLNISLPP